MMAQLVEQRIRNAWVAGSSPARGSLECGISTSVVHGLPKPGRRVRFPYPAQKDKALSTYIIIRYLTLLFFMMLPITYANLYARFYVVLHTTYLFFLYLCIRKKE